MLHFCKISAHTNTKHTVTKEKRNVFLGSESLLCGCYDPFEVACMKLLASGIRFHHARWPTAIGYNVYSDFSVCCSMSQNNVSLSMSIDPRRRRWKAK